MSVTEVFTHETPGGLVDGGRLLSSGKLGLCNTGDFFIAVRRARIGFQCPFENGTYEYNTAITWKNSGWLYGSFALIGFMIQEKAFGLANMKDSTKNPISNVTLLFGSVRKLTATLAIDKVNIEFDITKAVIPVVMSGMMSDVVPVEGTIG